MKCDVICCLQFRGGTRARAAECRHQVALWYKDQEFTLRKIDRTEDGFYRSLIQTHKDKKKFQRLSYKRMQEDIRQNGRRSVTRGGQLDAPDWSPSVEPDIVENTVPSSENDVQKTTPVAEVSSDQRKRAITSPSKLPAAKLTLEMSKASNDTLQAPDYVLVQDAPTANTSHVDDYVSADAVRSSHVTKSKALQVTRHSSTPMTVEVRRDNACDAIKRPVSSTDMNGYTVLPPIVSCNDVIVKLRSDTVPKHVLPAAKHHRTQMAPTMPPIS